MSFDRDHAAYGCLFCKTGMEAGIAAEIEKRFSPLEAISPTKTRYRRCQGRVMEEQATLFPGYVFFRAQEDFHPYRLTALDGVFRLLESSERDWRLCAADVEIVRRLFEEGGVIGLSQAYFEGERIRIVNGFMKAYEGQIVRVNRRARTAQISLQLQNKTLLFWLGYEEISRDGQ